MVARVSPLPFCLLKARTFLAARLQNVRTCPINPTGHSFQTTFPSKPATAAKLGHSDVFIQTSVNLLYTPRPRYYLSQSNHAQFSVTSSDARSSKNLLLPTTHGTPTPVPQITRLEAENRRLFKDNQCLSVGYVDTYGSKEKWKRYRHNVARIARRYFEMKKHAEKLENHVDGWKDILLRRRGRLGGGGRVSLSWNRVRGFGPTILLTSGFLGPLLLSLALHLDSTFIAQLRQRPLQPLLQFSLPLTDSVSEGSPSHQPCANAKAFSKFHDLKLRLKWHRFSPTYFFKRPLRDLGCNVPAHNPFQPPLTLENSKLLFFWGLLEITTENYNDRLKYIIWLENRNEHLEKECLDWHESVKEWEEYGRWRKKQFLKAQKKCLEIEECVDELKDVIREKERMVKWLRD